MIYIKNKNYTEAKAKWNEMVGCEYYGECGKESNEDYSTIEADYLRSDDEYEDEQNDYNEFVSWLNKKDFAYKM